MQICEQSSQKNANLTKKKMCEKPFHLANCIQQQNMQSLEEKHAKNLEHKSGIWKQ